MKINIDSRRVLTNVAVDITNIRYRIYHIYHQLNDEQPREDVTLQQQQPDVVYLGLDKKRRVLSVGGKFTMTECNKMALFRTNQM